MQPWIHKRISLAAKIHLCTFTSFLSFTTITRSENTRSAIVYWFERDFISITVEVSPFGILWNCFLSHKLFNFNLSFSVLFPVSFDLTDFIFAILNTNFHRSIPWISFWKEITLPLVHIYLDLVPRQFSRDDISPSSFFSRSLYSVTFLRNFSIGILFFLPGWFGMDDPGQADISFWRLLRISSKFWIAICNTDFDANSDNGL